ARGVSRATGVPALAITTVSPAATCSSNFEKCVFASCTLTVFTTPPCGLTQLSLPVALGGEVLPHRRVGRQRDRLVVGTRRGFTELGEQVRAGRPGGLKTIGAQGVEVGETLARRQHAREAHVRTQGRGDGDERAVERAKGVDIRRP